MTARILAIVVTALLWLPGRIDGQTAATAWPSSTPEQQGMDSTLLANVFDEAGKNDWQIHSLLVIRNGHVVLDAAFYPYDPATVHDVASVTKTLMSTLIGIAIDKRLVRDVNEPVLNFFSDRAVANVDSRKRRLTLDHLLSMRSGLCHAAEDDGEKQLDTMRATPDWTQFALDLPMQDEPGGRFAYCSATMQILSAVLTRATGMTALEFARKNLFDPLGIHQVIWPADPQGNNRGWGDCHLLPSDLAKFGALFLNGGTWNGTQLVSKKWIDQATATHAKDRNDDYGYLWWKPRTTTGMYDARGRGGQRLCVWPQKNLVVVMTGSGFKSGRVGDLIFASLVGDHPLPANLPAEQRLQRDIARARFAPEPRAVDVPEAARRITGRRYVFASNPIGFEAFSLTFNVSGDALLSIAVRDGNRVHETDCPVGLDGVYRVSPTGALGLPRAAKGSWAAADRFDLVLNEASDNHIYRLEMRFQGDTATVKIMENTGQVNATLVARADERR